MAKKNLTLEEKLEEAVVKDGPYEVPGNWVWINLKDICKLINGDRGKNYPSKDEMVADGIPFINAGALKVGKIDSQSLNYITENKFEVLSSGKIQKNDVLYCLRGTIGKNAYIVDEMKGAIASSLCIIRSDMQINSKYIFYLLNSETIIRQQNTVNNGTAQPNLSAQSVKEYKIPLPPLKEQQRIVDRIESLFEKLDKSKELIEEARDGFEKRKAAMLEQAFSGELTKEWRKLSDEQDEPLSDDNLEVLRNQYYNEICSASGKKTKLKESCKIDINGKTKGIDKLYDLPKSWRWVSIGQITWSISDGPHFSPDYTSNGIPIISSRNVKYKKIDFSDAKYVSYEDYCEFIKRGKPEAGDILLTKGGTTGIVTMVDTNVEFCVWVHVALLKLVEKIAYPEYIRDVLHSDLLYNQSQSQTHGVANRDLGLTRMVYMALPLPPIKEQKEIVRILDKLLEEELKIEELTQLEEQIELIKKSILAKAFRGELGTNCEEDESALKLLKEILTEQ